MVDDNDTDKSPDAPDAMERFLITFERSARRWEYVVYPALFAFIVLAGYGFFLIYSLTSDMNRIAAAIDPNMGRHLAHMTQSMDHMSQNLDAMTLQVGNMTDRVEQMATRMEALDNMEPMLVEINKLERSVQSMAVNTHLMRHDMGNMSSSVSRPMSVMNSMMPW